MTYPPVGTTLPDPATAPLIRVFAPVVMLPLVNVRAAPTVSSAPSVAPAALLRIKLLNVVEADPPIVCAALPFNVTVVAFAIRETATFAVQLPPTLMLTAALPSMFGSAVSMSTLKNCVGPVVVGQVAPPPAPENWTVPPVPLKMPLLLKS